MYFTDTFSIFRVIKYLPPLLWMCMLPYCPLASCFVLIQRCSSFGLLQHQHLHPSAGALIQWYVALVCSVHRLRVSPVFVNVSVSCFVHCPSCETAESLNEPMPSPSARALPQRRMLISRARCAPAVTNVLELWSIKMGDPLSVHLLTTWHAVASPRVRAHWRNGIRLSVVIAGFSAESL